MRRRLDSVCRLPASACHANYPRGKKTSPKMTRNFFAPSPSWGHITADIVSPPHVVAFNALHRPRALLVGSV